METEQLYLEVQEKYPDLYRIVCACNKPSECAEAAALSDLSKLIADQRAEVWKEAEAAARWPLAVKDQTHSVDNRRQGFWDAVESIRLAAKKDLNK